MSSDTTFDHDELVQILDKKNNDLELAAKIGQSLLEQNRDLQTKNEFLEESANRYVDTIVQLKHELNQRIELLRVYSHLDDDGFPRSNSDETLRERLKLSRSENERLRRECDALRQESATADSLERKHNIELGRQLDDANEKITSLQNKIEKKTQELNSQYETTGKLVKELGNKEKNEKRLALEKEEMSAILIEMIQTHDSMNGELKDMQDQYAELMANFAETEAELSRLRHNASLRMSFDSLYDSLASEMENSDSNHKPSTSAAIDSGIEQSLAAELSEPEKVETPKAVDYFSKQHVAAIQCDASTSCTDIFIESTKELSIEEKGNAQQQQNEQEQQSFPEPEATSTPIVRRKFSSFISPIRSNNRLASPLKYITSPCHRQIEAKSSEDRQQYEEPKLGQPGIPGTRDLDQSLKIIKVKEEVQKEFDAFCQRKGIDQKSFFGKSKNREASFSKSQDSSSSWIDYGSFFGATAAKKNLVMPTHQPLSLSLTRHGVLTRAELRNPSPTSSPQHSRSPLNILLASSSSSNTNTNTNSNLNGAQNGVLQRR